MTSYSQQLKAFFIPFFKKRPAGMAVDLVLFNMLTDSEVNIHGVENEEVKLPSH